MMGKRESGYWILGIGDSTSETQYPIPNIQYPLSNIQISSLDKDSALKTKKIEIVSHRGANGVAPENTFAAAQACLDLGLDYIEVDVWTSRDHHFYIMHDATVDRTTNGAGHLLSLTSAEIDKLDAGSWFAPQFAGERVPRLDDFLRWVKGKAKVFFDVKFAHPQQLIDLINETDMQQECFLWSGSKGWMSLLRELDATLPLKVNVSDAAGVRRAHKQYNANIVEVGPENLSADLIDTCRSLGIRVMVHTKDETADMFRDLLRWQIDMINLDRPHLFLKVLAEGNQ
jgi:glycerophosphoryl diester phosphodiesterase